MRRIDKLRLMTVSEIADVMINYGVHYETDFCKGICADNGPEEGQCRRCLIKWLQEDTE